MDIDKQLEKLIIKAIDLPTCPVKREHAIAQRAWLKKKVLELYSDKKPFDPRTETK